MAQMMKQIKENKLGYAAAVIFLNKIEAFCWIYSFHVNYLHNSTKVVDATHIISLGGCNLYSTLLVNHVYLLMYWMT